ncbi:hypothetical protein [Solitalea koreensis]|uniref:Tetratricopeptide repeat-containing protein n=1 Tax=Solitalea koreensis TaxID=543615 RepID=A0A521CAV5_9SPHI|nr:hypothetical protein [Solitalea koreensis]SMO55890.1 hypothetical protein SAMN06265350_103296 [Solitalea koreensis]
MSKLLPLALIVCFIISCSSPKSTFDKGNYDKAFQQSISRLQKDPKDKKASAVVREAYHFAQEDHLLTIKQAKLSNDIYRWETVVREYQSLNNMVQLLRHCPAALKLITNFNDYTNEENEARISGAQVRYELGNRALAAGDRQAAKDAYYHFLAANDLSGGDFKDALKLAEDARWAATLKVVVEDIPVRSQKFSLSDAYFREQVGKYLGNLSNQRNAFVAFYPPEEFNKTGLKQPDQILQFAFDEYIVGNTFVKENNFEAKSDTVVVGKLEGKEIKGIVKAKVSIFRKEVSTSGMLNIRMIDPHNNQVINQDQIPGTFVWAYEWGSYRGDERALTKNQREICKRRELLPPPPQDLFLEFTKPIYDQLTNKLKRYYVN